MVNEEKESKYSSQCGTDVEGETSREEGHDESERLKTAIKMEMEHQIQIALRYFDEIEDGLEVGDSSKIWYSVEPFLLAIGRISDLMRKCREDKDGFDELRKAVPEKKRFYHFKVRVRGYI